MLLSDRDIKFFLEDGDIKVSPKPNYKTQLGACSLDLHLSNEFLIFQTKDSKVYADTQNLGALSKYTKPVTIQKGDGFVLGVNQFVLGSTIEHIELSRNLAARLEGRSSMGRVGLQIHSTAGLIEPGWKGTITLELKNIGNYAIDLYPGVRICALTFELLHSSAEIMYSEKLNNKFAGQNGPTGSRGD